MSDEQHFDVSQFGDEIKRILVVAAHPDDLETTSGGTLALLIGRGVEVALLLGTDGDIGTHDPSFTRETLAAVRREETLAGAAALGIKDVFFLGHHDGELVADLALRAEVAGIYRRWQPDTIFTFDPAWGGQAHPDHIAAGRAAVDAYMPSKMELYHPEQLGNGVKVAGDRVADVKRFFFFGGSNRAGEITIDISSTWEKKIAATRCHLSQFGQKEEALEWLAAWNHETGKCCGLEYAEAFHPMQVW
jgi:LmbE family N-acetylglucosaminyl deacetylase